MNLGGIRIGRSFSRPFPYSLISPLRRAKTQNHYDDYTWEEMEDEDVAQYWAILGWTQETW